MIAKTKINMDLAASGPVRRMDVVQGDTNTRVLELSLFVNGIAWAVPQDATAQVRYGQAGGAGGVYDTLPDGTRAWSVSGNTVSVTLAPGMLMLTGDVEVQVELLRGSSSLATFSVCVHVEKNPALGSTEPPAYFNLLQWLKKELDAMGLPAEDVQVTVGSVTTLTPGQNAWVTVTQQENRAVLHLGIPAGYSPVPGVDYWTEAEQQAMADTLRGELAESLEAAKLELGQIGPEFAESIDQCTDTGKLYVLPDGCLYAYMTRTSYTEPPELYDPAAATLDQRHSGTPGTVVTGSGYVMTDYIPVDMAASDPVKLKITCDGFNAAATSAPKFQKIAYYDSDKSCIGSTYILSAAASGNGVKLEYSGSDTTVYVGYTNADAKEDFFDQIAYVRIEVTGTNSPAEETDRNLITSITDPDTGGTTTETGWLNTGHAFVPADYEDRILALEALAQTHGQKLDALQNGESVAIPAYWEDHLAEKADSIRALQEAGGKDCFSFGVLADIHESANLGKCSGALARRLLDSCDIKYALVLGDTVTRSSVSTEAEMLESFRRAEEILAPIRDRALQTRGNHDGCWGDDGSTYYLHDLTPEKLHSLIWRRVGMTAGVTADETGSAYYVDDPANRVRYILLNSHCVTWEENEDGTAKYSSFRNARLGQAQFDWLIQEALDVKAGWAIIVGTHVPLSDDYVSYFGGTVGDGVLLRQLLEAYNSRLGYAASFPGTLGVDEISLDADFTNAAGEVIAAVAGHAHVDSDGLYGIRVITTRCDAAEENTEELKGERVAGTTTEQSFDIFTVNRKTRTITATKIGAGEDRQISY